jgi:hypothetical protein
MCFTFPHFTPEPEFIQPDYHKWSAVQLGMSRDEITAKFRYRKPPHRRIPLRKSAPCVAGRGLAFVEGRSAMRSKLSIQAIRLIGQIGIRKIPGRSESRHC